MNSIAFVYPFGLTSIVYLQKKQKRTKKGLDIILFYGIINIVLRRGVAQFGRALRSGRRGRRFKSCHFDYLAGAPKFLEIESFGVFLRLKRDSGKWA